MNNNVNNVILFEFFLLQFQFLAFAYVFVNLNQMFTRYVTNGVLKS